jgi:CRP/FNR family transcriptional regulator, cyclic AMP receptor protein
MKGKRTRHLTSLNFLEEVGTQKTIRDYRNKQDVFLQGDAADAMFIIQSGNVKLTVKSKGGKNAVIAILGRGDSFGESCLASHSRRKSTATTVQPSTIVRVKKQTLARIIRQNRAFAEHLISHLLSRVDRIQEDFVALFFNLSEMRLARVLLSLDHFGNGGKLKRVIPHIDQETLAEMIGTTRSRVSYFMNRFRKLGFIDYDGSGLTIYSGLLKMALNA